MQIQRYEFVQETSRHSASMEQHPEGDWVRFEDVERLLREKAMSTERGQDWIVDERVSN